MTKIPPAAGGFTASVGASGQPGGTMIGSGAAASGGTPATSSVAGKSSAAGAPSVTVGSTAGKAPGTAGMQAGNGGVGVATAGSGASGTGAASGGNGTGSGPVKTAKDPKVPAVMGDCPPFAEGTMTKDFMGLTGVIFEVGPKMNGTGSLIFYWHGTGSVNSEYANSTIQMGVLSDLKAKGGILVSPQSGTGSGGDCSGTGTFYQDDFKVADQIAACAVRDWNIDPHRIWSTGCSAGGLMAGCMAMMRSSYLAGAVPNSGGEYLPIPLEDTSHPPSMMTIHGAPGQDVVIVDFSQTSSEIDDAVKMAGGFAIDCNHGGGHCGIPMLPPEVAMAGWQFMLDHPFGVSPEPYKMGLPSSFPSYCKPW